MAVLQTITTSSAKFRWHPQTTFDGGISSPTFKFGLDQAIPRLETMTEEIELRDSGETTRVGMAYGTRRTTFDPQFALTQPWWLVLLFPVVKKPTKLATRPQTYTFEKRATPLYFTLETRIKGTDALDPGSGIDKGADMKHTLEGCTVESASISCQVDQTAQVRMQCASGNAALAGTAFANFGNDTNTDAFTYTSAGAKITFKETSSGSAVDLAQVSEGTIDIRTGYEQKFYWNDTNSQSGKAGERSYSGTLKKILVNSEALQLIFDRNLKNTLTYYFSNKAANAAERFIQFAFTDVNFSRHSYAQQRTDDLIDELTWTASECVVTVGSSMASQPTGIVLAP